MYCAMRLVFVYIVVLILSVGCMSNPIRASSIQAIALQEATLASALVFEGVAVGQREGLDPVSGRPFTYFTFKILSVLKGTYAASTIELGFMGGTKNGFHMQVSDMIMPKLDERGIYFVEQLNVPQVNPLFGWHQGHYLIVMTPGSISKKVVPVNSPPNAMISAPTVNQFKQQVKNILGGSQ